MWMMILLAAGVAAAEDRNCNGLDGADEPIIDVADPACAVHVDPSTGLPYDTADWYHDYASHGCRDFVGDMDVDGDGFGFGAIDHGDSATLLSCDICPTVYNPAQDAVCAQTPHLDPPAPGVAGVDNMAWVGNVEAGDEVVVALSSTLGSFTVPDCPSATLVLADPAMYSDFTSTGDFGRAQRLVPGGAVGKTMFFQAVNLTTCEVSNLVYQTFE